MQGKIIINTGDERYKHIVYVRLDSRLPELASRVSEKKRKKVDKLESKI